MSVSGRSASLRDAPSFRRLWAATVVSRFGSEVTLLALPLLVVLELGLGTGAVGMVTAAEYLPWVLLALPAGVLADRLPRRPVLIACDGVRALALAVIPVAAWRGALDVPLLLVLVFVVGSATVLFDVGSGAFLPEVVRGDQLAPANGAIETASAVAFVVGPPLGGLLVAAVGASRAIVLDAVTFLVSAAFLAGVRLRTPAGDGAGGPPRPPVPEQQGTARTAPARPRWTAQALAGAAHLWRVPALRRLCAYSMLFNLVGNAMTVVYLVFLVTDAGLGPTALGLVLGLGAVGAPLGGLLSARLARRLGVGRALLAASAVIAVAEVALAATPASPAAAPWAVTVLLVLFAASTAYTAQVATVRQTLTPGSLLGRMTAAWRLAAYGVIPVGALAGGLLGEVLGRRPTLVACAALLAALTVLPASAPVRRLVLPEPAA